MNLPKHQGSADDHNIRKNIQRKLAGRLKQITQKHRVIQKTYMDCMENKPNEDSSGSQGGLFEDKVETYSEIAKVREEGINNLVTNLNELAIIFKELNELVLDQGTILDRIDFNLNAAKENTSKAVKELISAEKHQQCTRLASCLVCLIVMIGVLVLVLILKHF